MPKIDHYPKSLKKAIRYLKQEAPLEQLDDFKQTIERVIQLRMLKHKQN
jgi:hypothetical protein